MSFIIVDFADHKLKLKENKKKDRYLDFAWELKKLWNDYTNCNWCSWYTHQRIDKGTGGRGMKRTSGDHSNYGIIEIGQNTEKSPGDMRRLVTQTSADVKNSQRVI